MMGSESMSLEELAQGIHKAFEGDQINKDQIEKIMSQYDANSNSDWKKYVVFNESKYTRNLVDAGLFFCFI